ncbi:MAG: DUF4340 domain-containing protein [Lachnospiraceae bacterium]|nr:DUF4340 domain-containing protein [Lachnospiraceae bacterium]
MDAREERELRLKRLKRKRAITVVVLLVLLVGLGGGYYAARQYAEQKAAKEAEEEAAKNATTEYKVTTFTYYDVAEFEYTNEKTSYHFVKNEDSTDTNVVWVRKGMEDFPVDLDALVDVICTPCGFTSTTKIESEDADLSGFGFDAPKITVKVTLKDGAIHDFKVGNEAPYDEGYYLLYETTGEIWVVESWFYKELSTEEMKLVQAENFPETSEEYITEVTVAVRDGDTVSYQPQVAEDDTVTFPSIFKNCEKFIATTVQEYDCKDFSQYGLDNPYVTVTVHYMENVTDAEGNVTSEPRVMTAEIGDLTVSKNYYVRINGSPYVYIMTAANAAKYIPQ